MAGQGDQLELGTWYWSLFTRRRLLSSGSLQVLGGSGREWGLVPVQSVMWVHTSFFWAQPFAIVWLNRQKEHGRHLVSPSHLFLTPSPMQGTLVQGCCGLDLGQAGPFSCLKGPMGQFAAVTFHLTVDGCCLL